MSKNKALLLAVVISGAAWLLLNELRFAFVSSLRSRNSIEWVNMLWYIASFAWFLTIIPLWRFFERRFPPKS